jgi:hypothetical protein
MNTEAIICTYCDLILSDLCYWILYASHMSTSHVSSRYFELKNRCFNGLLKQRQCLFCICFHVISQIYTRDQVNTFFKCTAPDPYRITPSAVLQCKHITLISLSQLRGSRTHFPYSTRPFSTFASFTAR